MCRSHLEVVVDISVLASFATVAWGCWQGISFRYPSWGFEQLLNALNLGHDVIIETFIPCP